MDINIIEKERVSFDDKTNLENYWRKKTIVSFILSVFVVFIHMSSFSQYTYEGTDAYTIVNFCNIFFRKSFVLLAVPLFFIVSGATLFRNYDSIQYKKKLLQKVKTLLIPFICWNIINMIFSIVTSYSFVSNYFAGRQKFEITVLNIFLSIFFYKCNRPFWFVFNLMIFTVLTPIINRIITQKSTGVILVVAILILEVFDVRLPKNIFFEPESIIYYLFGCFIGKHYFNIFTKPSKIKMRVLSTILFTLITIYKVLVAYKLIELLKSIDIIITILYCLSFWVMIDVFINKITVKPYMNTSFFIYAMHVNISAIIIKLFYLLMPQYPLMSILNFIICSILSIILICIICKFLDRFFPRTYRVLSGNR